MRTLDQLFERSTRSLAQRTSRRSLLASLGQLLTGAALLRGNGGTRLCPR